MIVSRLEASPRSAKYARISISPVSSPCEPAAGWSVTAGSPAISASISCRRHISSSAPCAPSSSWCGWRSRNPGSGDDSLVDPRVVLHRAGAERVEAGVDAEVPIRERREVPDELGLADLGQSRRALAAELRRHLRRGQVVRRARGRRGGPDGSSRRSAPPGQLHPATARSVSASRSTSAGVRFSVSATSRTSSMPS